MPNVFERTGDSSQELESLKSLFDPKNLSTLHLDRSLSVAFMRVYREATSSVQFTHIPTDVTSEFDTEKPGPTGVVRIVAKGKNGSNKLIFKPGAHRHDVDLALWNLANTLKRQGGLPSHMRNPFVKPSLGLFNYGNSKLNNQDFPPDYSFLYKSLAGDIRIEPGAYGKACPMIGGYQDCLLPFDPSILHQTLDLGNCLTIVLLVALKVRDLKMNAIMLDPKHPKTMVLADVEDVLDDVPEAVKSEFNLPFLNNFLGCSISNEVLIAVLAHLQKWDTQAVTEFFATAKYSIVEKVNAPGSLAVAYEDDAKVREEFDPSQQEDSDDEDEKSDAEVSGQNGLADQLNYFNLHSASLSLSGQFAGDDWQAIAADEEDAQSSSDDSTGSLHNMFNQHQVEQDATAMPDLSGQAAAIEESQTIFTETQQKLFFTNVERIKQRLAALIALDKPSTDLTSFLCSIAPGYETHWNTLLQVRRSPDSDLSEEGGKLKHILSVGMMTELQIIGFIDIPSGKSLFSPARSSPESERKSEAELSARRSSQESMEFGEFTLVDLVHQNVFFSAPRPNSPLSVVERIPQGVSAIRAQPQAPFLAAKPGSAFNFPSQLSRADKRGLSQPIEKTEEVPSGDVQQIAARSLTS